MPMVLSNVSSLKEKRDVAGLLRLVKSKDLRVRRAAIQALGEVGDASAVPDLVETLLAPATRHAEKADAARALGMLGDDAAIAALLQASGASLIREQELAVRAQASPRRTRRSDSSASFISSDEYLLRSTIAQALANIGSDTALRGLFEMLSSETGPTAGNMQTAIQVAISSALDRDQSSWLKVLHEQLSSPSVECRHLAVRSLGEIGESGVELLIGVADDEKEASPVRRSAIACLGRIGDVRALNCLDRLAKSKSRSLASDARFNGAIIRQRHMQPLF